MVTYKLSFSEFQSLNINQLIGETDDQFDQRSARVWLKFVNLHTRRIDLDDEEEDEFPEDDISGEVNDLIGDVVEEDAESNEVHLKLQETGACNPSNSSQS